MEPGAGKLREKKSFKNKTFWGSQKVARGHFWGVISALFLKAYFSIFWGVPKPRFLTTPPMKIALLRLREGPPKGVQKEPFLGSLSGPPKPVRGGSPRGQNAKNCTFGSKTLPRESFCQGLPGGSLGIPGSPLERLRIALYILKKLRNSRSTASAA